MQKSKQKMSFTPNSKGCSLNCKINKYMKKNNQEICCSSFRQCCFFCYDDGCPILEKFKKLIKKFGISFDI